MTVKGKRVRAARVGRPSQRVPQCDEDRERVVRIVGAGGNERFSCASKRDARAAVCADGESRREGDAR